MIVFTLVLQVLQTLLHLLGAFHIVPKALPGAGGLQLLYLFLGRLQVQRIFEQLQRGLDGVEFGLIFFKFQHSIIHFPYFPYLTLYTKIQHL